MSPPHFISIRAKFSPEWQGAGKVHYHSAVLLLLLWSEITMPHCKCTGRCYRLLGIAACRTSSGAHGSAAGSSARNHRSPMFRSFNSVTSPGGGAVTGTSPCHPLQLIVVLPCCLGLGVLSPRPFLPPQPEPKAPFLSLLCQVLCCPL